MRKIILVVAVIIIIILLAGAWFLGLFKDTNKDGVNEFIVCAQNLYDAFSRREVEIDSQCLGTCGNYAVDIVHVPRNATDNLVENQCEAYRNGQVSGFIELDKDGNVVRALS